MHLSRTLGSGPALALAAAALLGCSEAAPVEYRYVPYDGDAYPNRREQISIPPGGMAVVTDSLSDTLSLIDIEAGERLGAYAVGRDPVTIDGPHHVAVDVAGGAIYTALSYPLISDATGPHASHGGSVTPGYVQKLALDDLRVLGQMRVDTNPGDIVVSDDGKRIVVSHFDLKRVLDNPGDLEAARAPLSVIDPSKLSPAGAQEADSISLCMAPHGIALSRPDGAIAYVACFSEDSLAIVDLTRPDATPKLVPVGPAPSLAAPTYGPYAAVMSPDGKIIAVSNTESGDVRFFDVATETFDGERTFSPAARGAPYFVAWSPDGKRLYVPTQGPDALVLIDVEQGNAEIAYRALGDACEKPHIVDFAGGETLFLVCEGDHKGAGKVLKLDPETLETIDDIEVGVYPDAFVRVPGAAR